MPGPVQVDAIGYQVIMRVHVVVSGDLRQSNTECLATLLTAVNVQQDVAGNPEHPRPSITHTLRYFVDTTPYDEERVRGDVLSRTAIRSSMYEQEKIGVHRFVQCPKRIRPVSGR